MLPLLLPPLCRLTHADAILALPCRLQVKDVWHGYSARAPHPPTSDKGITRSVGHLTLTRWVSWSAAEMGG